MREPGRELCWDERLERWVVEPLARAGSRRPDAEAAETQRHASARGTPASRAERGGGLTTTERSGGCSCSTPAQTWNEAEGKWTTEAAPDVERRRVTTWRSEAPRSFMWDERSNGWVDETEWPAHRREREGGDESPPPDPED